jgi:hypothetical protein
MFAISETYMRCARRRRGKRAGAEGRCGKGCPVQPGKIRWDENAGLRRDAIRSQVIDALEAQEIKETGNSLGQGLVVLFQSVQN